MTNCCFYLTSSLLGLKSQGQIDLYKFRTDRYLMR